jgi:transcriptional regulator with GAF, ATPase, and Fis domain
MPHVLHCLARPAGSHRDDDPFPEVDGSSRSILILKQHMSRVARDRDVTVVILGESGTGKEVVGRAIHRASPRCAAPLVVVNCAGLSPTLAEDELFGHVRGAFTGAIGDRPGPFERAHGGTVLLDEVGELSADLQMKLLRALQERTVQRLGGRHESSFDVRVMAATNVDLAAATARGRFRQDLYYRLKVYQLVVPPVRHRGAADVRQLVHAVLRRLAERRGREPWSIDDDVIERFVRYRWPGNVREMENTIERMTVAADGPRLSRQHLPEDFGAGGLSAAIDAGPGGEWSAAKTRLPSAEAVRDALERYGFSRRGAADALGLSRHQLYRLLRQYGDRASRREP